MSDVLAVSSSINVVEARPIPLIFTLALFHCSVFQMISQVTTGQSPKLTTTEEGFSEIIVNFVDLWCVRLSEEGNGWAHLFCVVRRVAVTRVLSCLLRPFVKM